MKNRLEVCVIGKGPLGLSLARNLHDMNHCVTTIDSDTEGLGSAALNNLGIAISGMRFFQHRWSRLESVVDGYEAGRSSIERILRVPLLHFGSEVNHGLFSFDSQTIFEQFQKILHNMNIDQSSYEVFPKETAMNLLGERMLLQSSHFTKSPEVPFSQTKYLKQLDHCRFKREILLKSLDELKLIPNKMKKSGIGVWIGNEELQDFDYVFIAAGRFASLAIKQLSLESRIVPVVNGYYTVRFPNDPSFRASVYHDFSKSFTIARHKRENSARDFCLMVNLGIPTAEPFDPLAVQILTKSEREEHLERIKAIYDFPHRQNEIRVKKCYLTDFGKVSTSSERIISRHQAPFIFYDSTWYPGVLLGSCFRATLAFNTSLEMLAKARITPFKSKEKCTPTDPKGEKSPDQHIHLVDEEDLA